MKILLVYPRCPDTFWSFRHALKFISRKASLPPLGLLTVAALLPPEWEKRFIDLNVTKLSDRDIQWADYVFLSAMSIQRESAQEIIARCKSLGRRVVAGGPLFTASHEEFEIVDHLVLNEAELTLPHFLEDLRLGQAKHLYTSTEWADISTTPLPLWDLIDFKDYATMNVQYSRGCPYDCEFCDITVLYGRQPRTKTREQIVGELESLYAKGWRGHVFLVDDNFIGNKKKVKREILPAIAQWMQERGHPFTLSTEASVNLADDEELMKLMIGAGFNGVFVGIESPNEESLIECGKYKNQNRDLLGSIRKIQDYGFEVQGGFIVGFDNDPESIFDRLAGFIQESGIVTAMVGLLNAPRGTRLYHRLMNEGRMEQVITGDNTDSSMNFVPAMNRGVLMEGYRSILQRIYSPKPYYERVGRFLRNYRPVRQGKRRFEMNQLGALFKSIVVLGVIGRERLYYWKMFFWSLFRRPSIFPLTIRMCIYGFHFRKVFQQHLYSTEAR